MVKKLIALKTKMNPIEISIYALILNLTIDSLPKVAQEMGIYLVRLKIDQSL